MSFLMPENDQRAKGDLLHVPDMQGVTKWFNGDVYTMKLTGEQTNGALGFVEASVPPGGGPPPHIHPNTDETFYLVSGELEILANDKVFTASAGDLIFCPKGNLHRFFNRGILPSKLLFIFTPGGTEGVFIEGGDEPQPGVAVQPWGPERINERLVELLAQYDTVLPPPPQQ